MGRRLVRAAIVACSCIAGCGPEIPRAWQIVDVLDLGMRVEVEELGGLGEPGDPMGRSFHDAMPLDRVRADIMVAGTTGPVPPEELSFAWFACPALGCGVDAPPDPCPEAGLGPTDECSLGVGSEARFAFADFDVDEALTPGRGTVTLRAIGGLVRDGGSRACLGRLERSVDLGRCMIVDSYHPLGSIGELIDLAHSRGVEIPEDLVPDTARQFPRNRVPEVEGVLVTTEGGAPQRVAAGGRFTARVGETLQVVWQPTTLDREEVTIVASDGSSLEYMEPLSAAWWTTQRAEAFDFVPSIPRVSWRVGPERGTFTLYVVVTDGSNANGWASFEVEVTR